ncbi:MAG: DUF349 domain-containing protein [Pseudomonadota bacterium]
MNKQTKTVNLGNHQAILDEISALLGASGSIDETRAKKVRKATDALRNSNDAATAGDEQPAENKELDAKIDAGLERLRARVHKQVERRNSDYEKTRQLTGELETALKDNELQQAERSYHKLMSIMGNIPGLSEQRWQDIEKRLNRVRPRLRKLESWRHWGTTQARQDLTDQIRQLKDSGLAPEKLARRIKQAREQWQAWDKSGDHAEKALWKTFDQACEEAYKPCSAHFKKLKQQRAENLRQRQAVIDSLNARFDSSDWKQPDWREIDKFVSHSRRDFYKIGNVDFKHRKQVASALDEALERFEDHLSRERERSLRTREKLIADIEALAAVDNLRDALNQLDTLKKQWTITVTGKRNLENRLWKSFQAACDGTYRRRDAERKQHDAERDANLKQKQALIEELTRAAATADKELLANASTLARIRERWQTIGRVPRNHEKSLEKRWGGAQQQFRKALTAAESRAQASELDNIAKRAALCNLWEQTILADGTIDTDGVQAEWNALPALSSANAEMMDQRFAQALNRPDDPTLSGNLAARQDACLKLEVLLELESPQECQAERMAYQIERLNASMKKALDAQESPEDLLLAALTTGAVPAEAVGAIEQRIEVCLASYKRRS